MAFIHQVEPWLSGKERTLIDAYLQSGGWITEHTETEALESAIKDFLSVKYVVLTTSGTAALILSLIALGIKKGDKVIVPNLTMVATANAVRLLGAEPVFADIDPLSLCLDIKTLSVPKGTKALIHVSLNGRTGNIEAVRAFCKKHKLRFLEDSCQAFTSKHNGNYVGTFGEIGCYSLSPHKIITTGQGGIIVTNNKELYEGVKRLKDFGRLIGGKDFHEALGYNFKFTDLQAAFGRGQFATINQRIKMKKALYASYRKHLAGIEEVEFVPTDLRETTPWFVDILVPAHKREPLMQYLKEQGIGSRPFYPPVTSQPIYKNPKKKRLIVSERIASRGLWLPSSCFLQEGEVRKVCTAIKKYFHA